MDVFFQGNLFYFLLVMLIFGIGDLLGVLSKAKISSVFVVMITFMVAFMTGIFPKDIIEQAGLTSLASMSAGLLIFHMGTMINLKQLLQQWKTVVVAIISMVIVMLAVFALIPMIGYENAIVAIPVLNGGIISTQIMSAKASALGLVIPAALAAILYAVKKFAGSYPASLFGVKEAKEVLKQYRSGNYQAKASADTTNQKDGFYQRHQKFYSDFVCILITVFFAWLSVSLGKLIPTINYSIWALLFGAVFGYFKLVPERILDKGKSSGLISVLVYATIIPSLGKINVNDLMSLSLQVILILVVTIAALIICFYLLPLHKILGSKNLSVGVALCQYLGFPATFLISNEVAKAVTDDPKEQQIVLDHIMPSYVVAGIATVTTLSIVIAGIFVNLI